MVGHLWLGLGLDSSACAGASLRRLSAKSAHNSEGFVSRRATSAFFSASPGGTSRTDPDQRDGTNGEDGAQEERSQSTNFVPPVTEAEGDMLISKVMLLENSLYTL